MLAMTCDALTNCAAAVRRGNREEFEPFLGEDFDAYVSSMSRPGTWGDELTLRAACDAYGLAMSVVTSDAQNWWVLPT
jgi:hypothetical protein